jgi:hypothetical protein
MAARKNQLGTTLNALQQAEAQVQLLKKKLATERVDRLRDLHSTLGFASRRELIDALGELDGKAPAARSAANGAIAPRKSKRARLTPDLKAEVIKMVKGGAAGSAVAERFGISVQSVQNIKSAAGLVRGRKKNKSK